MAKGSAVPGGVRSFSHKAMSDKGSKHPEDVGSGLAGVERTAGGKSGGGDKDFAARAKASQPSGVVRGDGTETLKGTKVVHKQSKVTQPPRSGSKRYPGEVKQHDGKKAPRSVK